MTLRERTKLFAHGNFEVHLNFANVLCVYDTDRNAVDYPQLTFPKRPGVGRDVANAQVTYPNFRNVPEAVKERVRKVLLRRRKFGGGSDRFCASRGFGFDADVVLNHEVFSGPSPVLFFRKEDRFRQEEDCFAPVKIPVRHSAAY